MIFQKTIQQLACVCVLFAATTSVLVASEPTESQFQIEFLDGTILTSTFTEPKLMWTDVSEFGEMKKRSIDVSKILSLTLAEEPASAQLAAVFNLISDLDSDDFFTREEAEQQLRKNARRFRDMIAKYDALKTPDGNYRLQRILSSLRVSPNAKTGFLLDVLILDDGSKLSGDAGMGTLQFTINGKQFDLSRKQLAKITRANEAMVTRPETREFVETKLFHDHAKFMKDRELKLIDFEHKPDGTPLTKKDKNASTTFVDDGLILGTAYPMGCVGVSGFEIESGDKPVGLNSVCVYKSKVRLTSKFSGIMEITFCQPGKQHVPHGVKDFGMFLSKVNHSRDILVEAYDATDRLIGVCESNDEVCTFCGISSSVPIAKVRAVSNPWILAVRRKMLAEMIKSDKFSAQLGDKDFEVSYKIIDHDFAADSMMFSSPVPIDSSRDTKHFLGRNGDMLDAKWIRVFDADRIEFGTPIIDLMNISLSQANTVGLKRAPKVSVSQLRRRGTWKAMLRDNSVLEWNPNSPLRSNTLKQELSREDVIAIWPSTKQPQLPLSGDFDAGKNVLVYPGCRVATTEVKFDKNGFRWNGGKVLKENLHEENVQKVEQRSIEFDIPDQVAPSSNKFSFNTNDMADYETPTIWLEKPTSMLASQGALRLDNGEVIVFGTDTLTTLNEITPKQVELTFRGKEIAIPISRIVAIVPPQTLQK